MTLVSPRNDGNSYIIHIVATAETPQLAADIANAYARAFIAARREAVSSVGAQAHAWLATYAEQLRQEVVQADAAVAHYESTQGLTPLRGGTLTSQTLVDMNAALSALTGEIAERRSAVGQLQAAAHAGADLSANALAGQSPLLGQLLARQAENAEQEARLRTMYGSSHPDVISAQAQERRLQQQVNSEVAKVVHSASADLGALESRRAALEARVRSLQAQIGSQGEADVQLQALQREADSKRQIYQTVLARLMELDAQHGMEQADARIVSEALPPVGPSGPHRAMLVAGAFLGACGIGATISVPLSMLSRRFRDAEHIEEEIGLPVLGMFPRPAPGVAPHDIVQAMAGSPEAEAVLRVLPNILRDRGRDGVPRKSIVVASALPGEGKTSFAISLGRAAAQLGVSVLLIDCDLRRPAVDRLLSREPVGAAGRQNGAALVPKRGPEPDIMSLASMMPDRPRFVSGQDVARLLTRVTADYDLVLLDAPPVLVLADALSLATAADGVILVVDWRSTPRRAIAAAVQVLRRQGADLLGAVASKADLRKDANASSHYFHYHSDYFTQVAARPVA
jgi:Mrp family chromosome partitioning ATPase